MFKRLEFQSPIQILCSCESASLCLFVRLFYLFLVYFVSWKLIFNLRFQAQASICVSRALRWWEKTLKTNMVEIHSAQELVDSLLNAGDRLVVVDFYSPRCGGCKALHPKVLLLLKTVLPRPTAMAAYNLHLLFKKISIWFESYLIRSVSWLNWTQMQFFSKLIMKNSKLCVTLSTSMSYHSLGSTEVQRAGFAALAAPMQL